MGFNAWGEIMVENVKLPNHIEEYINKDTDKTPFIDLFEEGEIDLKTDISMSEIIFLNALIYNNAFLISKNIPSPYADFIGSYLRLKVSLDRKSRQEFVIINKKDKFEDNLTKFNEYQQLKKVKE